MNWRLQPAPLLSDKQYCLWQKILEERTAIYLGNHKSILQSGLLRRMRELNCDNYDDYYRRVTDDNCHATVEWEELLNSLTIQQTRFFRDPPAYAVLQDYLSQRLKSSPAAPLELWSVGCATGEEAYSLAMTAAEVIRVSVSDHLFAVTATDISNNALTQAKLAEYKAAQLNTIDASLRYRYFRAISSKRYQVVPAIRSRMCFSRANIVKVEQLPEMLMDVIYCQNMLIYFKQSRRIAVLNALYKRLKPGGLLITAPSESQGWHRNGLKRIRNNHVEGYIKQ